MKFLKFTDQGCNSWSIHIDMSVKWFNYVKAKPKHWSILSSYVLWGSIYQWQTCELNWIKIIPWQTAILRNKSSSKHWYIIVSWLSCTPITDNAKLLCKHFLCIQSIQVTVQAWIRKALNGMQPTLMRLSLSCYFKSKCLPTNRFIEGVGCCLLAVSHL